MLPPSLAAIVKSANPFGNGHDKPGLLPDDPVELVPLLPEPPLLAPG
jgi:hypothetical protein